MSEQAPLTVLCLASYEKGSEFIQTCKRQGCRVLLVTVIGLREAPWPRESLDDLFFMPDLSDVPAVIRAVSYLARSWRIDRVVPLDDYDVETAAVLREHLTLPGQGTTAARAFRDKLTMRTRAAAAGVRVPAFSAVTNDAALSDYLERVPPPWVLKPRSDVSTIGISVVQAADDLWAHLHELGDRRSFYLVEQYVRGGVYHVDSITTEGAVVFAEAHQYGRPPLDVFHGGGIFITRTLPRDGDEATALRALNAQVLSALGLVRGAAHLEAIKGEDGHLYFLEVGARVGGAYIADMVAAATGVNLWSEWATIELAQGSVPYTLPPRRFDYAGTIISLARQEEPETGGYTDPEIVQRLHKPHHVGFVLASPDPERIATLLESYGERIGHDFYAALPPYIGRPPTGPSTT